VDGIEATCGNQMAVIRVDVQSEVGRQLGALYGFQYTPTFILFDGQGKELWRSIGDIDPKRVYQYAPPLICPLEP
jgi:thioredoxin-related protein